MNAAALEAFLKDVARDVGPDAVNVSAETIARYGENTMPGGDRPPAAVVTPSSTQHVQAIVKAANAHKIPLYPISTGNNIGLGSRSATLAGQVVVEPCSRSQRAAGLCGGGAGRQLSDDA